MSRSTFLIVVGLLALLNAGVASSTSRADLVSNAEPEINLGSPALQTTDGRFAFVVGSTATLLPLELEQVERVDLGDGSRTPVFSVAGDASARISSIEAGGGKLAVLVARDKPSGFFPPFTDYELVIVDRDGSDARSVRRWSALANAAGCPSIFLESVTDRGEALVSVKKTAEACSDQLSYELHGYRAEGGNRLLVRARAAYSRGTWGSVIWDSSRAIGPYLLTTRTYHDRSDAEIREFGKSKVLKRIPMLERPKLVEREVDLDPRGRILVSTRVNRRTGKGIVPKLASVRLRPSFRSRRSILIAKGPRTVNALFCGDAIMVATDTPVTDGKRWSIRGYVVKHGRVIRSDFSYDYLHDSFERMRLLSCRNGTLLFTGIPENKVPFLKYHYALAAKPAR